MTRPDSSSGASPDFPLSEAGREQLQSLMTLSALGWRYVPRAEADRQRGHRRTSVLLDDILRTQLRAINRIRVGERSHPFTEGNVEAAVRRLADVRFDGLLRTNEQVTDLLQLGITLPQTVDGLSREHTFNYIDWKEPRANAFHMTSEFPVDWPDGASIRPDIVLFVNGIPFAVIEVKASREETKQGVSQQIRNQKPDVGAPNMFFSIQLLIAANSFEPRYATVGTAAKHWSPWKEHETPHLAGEVINRQIDTIEEAKIFEDFLPHRSRHDGMREAGGRFATPLDEMLVGLCRPERLLDLARRFVLFDGPDKKIARHQQYFAVRDLLKRVVEERDEKGRRAGGVVWHTQGSGKSLTMVMLAKALAMAVPGARIVMVTDRTDLDRQIEKTFRATGLEPVRATTGEHLLQLIDDKAPVVTTLINKFKAGLNKRKLVDPSTEIFVLVDESHRTQYGSDLESLHESMRKALPSACLVGFTGTPIAKRERNTFAKFGRPVNPTYPMKAAVADGAVVPLLYEGRHVEEDVNEAALDSWFDRVTAGLTPEQAGELKRKMSRPSVLRSVSARLRCIAFDVSRHFADNFQPLGLKGQLVAPLKRDAIALKKALDELGEVTSEIIISAPDEREGETSVDEETDDQVVAFWRRMMERYKSEEEYNRDIIEHFKGPDAPDILIVVSKLLTGFDAPRNTAIYLAKPLVEHNLLQAIARVNRVFDEDGAPDKPFGYVVDYCGVLKSLGEALAANDALAAFDQADLEQAVGSILDEARTLPGKHAALLDLFRGVSNVFDEEDYARALKDEALRAEFYRALSAFSRTLTVALASRDFIDETPPDRLARWRQDEKRFTALRAHVRARYAERDAIDWTEIEKRVRQVLDQNITAHEVTRIVEPLQVFEPGAIEAARKDGRSDASIADEIAHRTLRTIEEKWDEDPAFYERFSALIKKTIDEFRQGRLDERAYLERIREQQSQVETRNDAADPTPEVFRGKGHETAFWGLARRELRKASLDEQIAVDIAAAAAEIISRHRKVGWHNDRGVQNLIRNDLDDFFFDRLSNERSVSLDPALIDAIVDEILSSARVRMKDDGRAR